MSWLALCAGFVLGCIWNRLMLDRELADISAVQERDRRRS